MPQGHCANVPRLLLEEHVFGYFSATTGWNHSRFSAFATLCIILTDNGRAKPYRFQIRSSKYLFMLHFLHSVNNVKKKRIFPKNFLFLGSQMFGIVLNVTK